MKKQQLAELAATFASEHTARCPQPDIATGITEVYDAGEYTTLTCPTCGVVVTRTNFDDDWTLSWTWPAYGERIFHPTGCNQEPKAHSHDERGDIQLSLVP